MTNAVLPNHCPEQTVQIFIAVFFFPSRPISGTALWAASAFGNADANCMNPTQVSASVVLTGSAADYGLAFYGADNDLQSVWPSVSISVIPLEIAG